MDESIDHQDHHIVDDLGAEVTGIAFPVSICMVLTIALVRILNSDGNRSGSEVIIAEAIYSEQDGDTNSQKLSGSLLNAIVFIAIVTVMTFVIVLLFKYGCVKFIYAYMGFALFTIFFFITGGVVIDLLAKASIRLDAFSLVFMLYNFSAVGSVCIFFMPAPLVLKQGYLTWTGTAVAYIFTYIPAWTTWILLVAMAIYDLFAVLTPKGPLQMLVNLAIERQQEIPALVYEAREVRRTWRRRAPAPAAADAPLAGGAGPNAVTSGPVAEGVGSPAHDGQLHVQEIAGDKLTGSSGGTASPPACQEMARRFVSEEDDSATAETGDASRCREGASSSPNLSEPLMLHNANSTADAEAIAAEPPASEEPCATDGAAEPTPADAQQPARRLLPRRQREDADEEDDDPYGLGIPSAVKLGLGDFIFYSVLVGRASMYDWMTVYASFVAVISGLGITLLLLAVAKKALPALPVSIALGVLFYFLTRLSLEPFIVPAWLNLVGW